VKIYTKRGDDGETDLFGGVRVGKESDRVEAYGAVDELNALLGACVAASPHEDLRNAMQEIQRRLFDLGAYLASPAEASTGKTPASVPLDADIAELENHIDALESELEPLKRFVLPGGTQASASIHVARTVCRRAERRVLALHRVEPVEAVALRFLNRLSDLLFVMARVENRRAGVPDVEWEARRR
jgi:cob(I)alamin adenosyltransferase